MGRYDQGATKNVLWFTEIIEVQKALKQFAPMGNVLELACGTGWWTQQLVQYVGRVTAVDASAEVLAINKNKVGTDKVIFIQTDIFNWRPDTQYDIVFFSFWLSHVPAQKFESFWNTVRLALKPHGRVFFIDSFKSKKNNKTPPFNNQNVVTSTRTLNNGKKFNIIKIMYDPKELEKRLERLGWRISIKHTHNHFLYGYGESA